MTGNYLPLPRLKELLKKAQRTRVVVVGDVMLDQFIWGNVSRISPEAPVPIVEFVRESFMPGGAANVARNLSALTAQADLFGFVGRDDHAKNLQQLLNDQQLYQTLFSNRELAINKMQRDEWQKPT